MSGMMGDDLDDGVHGETMRYAACVKAAVAAKGMAKRNRERAPGRQANKDRKVWGCWRAFDVLHFSC